MLLILHSDLHLYLYKITVAHNFITHDKQERLQFAAWAEHDNVWLTDEAHFHLAGTMNKKNV
jgi:hypothetical protein